MKWGTSRWGQKPKPPGITATELRNTIGGLVGVKFEQDGRLVAMTITKRMRVLLWLCEQVEKEGTCRTA